MAKTTYLCLTNVTKTKNLHINKTNIIKVWILSLTVVTIFQPIYKFSLIQVYIYLELKFKQNTFNNVLLTNSSFQTGN